MLKRTDINRVEAAVEKHFDTKQYTWHKYTSPRGTKLEGPRGREVVLREGDLYGVKEYTTKEDMYLVLKTPDVIFKVGVARSDKLMEEKSKEFKGKTPVIPKNPPTKLKIDLSAKPAKKTLKEAAAPKLVKVGKPVLNALQKKIVKVKAEISALKKLKPNASNLRKIDAAKAELKKFRIQEKKSSLLPKDMKQPAPTSAPVQPHKEVKKIAAKKSKVKIQLHTPVVDEDDDEIPMGSVRYGGKFIEPEELEFDDDTSGFDIPFDESWSGNSPVKIKKAE